MKKKNRKIKLKKKSKIPFIVHPVIFSVYPIILLFNNNIKETFIGNVYRPMFLSLLFSGLFFVLLNYFLKNLVKSGIITSVSLLVFYSYGHLYNFLEDFELFGYRIFSHYVLFPLLLIISYFIINCILKAKKIDKINLIFNIVSILIFFIALVQSGYGIYNYHYKAYQLLEQKLRQDSRDTRKNIDRTKSYPDIYYIIIDGHARQDVMKELFNYDNSDFINFLKGKNFYVADKSRSNYCQTFLSLASSLNMGYLDKYSREGGRSNDARIFLGEMIRHNKVFSVLKNYGYIIVSYFSGFVGTELKGIADIYLPDDKEQIFAEEMTEFDTILINTTLITGIQSILNLGLKNKIGQHKAYSNRTEYVLNTIHLSFNIPSPKFVFAHILAPHPPFVFDENGPTDKWVGTKGIEFADGDMSDFSREKYKIAYKEQAIYIDRRIKGMIDRLIASTKGKAIIILQADHGSGLGWHAFDMTQTDLKERFSILNAYYFPDGNYKELNESITPVNTFRIILNQYFGHNLEILPDKSYYSTWDAPFQFTEINNEK